MNELTRRAFLQGASAAIALPALAPASAKATARRQDAKPAWKLGGFTKWIQDLSFEKTAQAGADLGWDGIELPLRAKGHVLPERVDEDLPRMAEALKAKGLEILVLATDIRGADEPLTEKVLRAAVKAGLRLYRLGPLRYKEGTPLPRQLDEFRARLKNLAALNRELGVTGLIQNHSGNGYVGASIWDLHELIKDFDAKQFGVHYDIGHATVEAGLSWPTNFALVQDRIGAVIVKDFYWKHTPGEGAKTVWCPIGQGSISPKFFGMLRASGFKGSITAQFEYPIEGGDSLENKLRAMKADHRTLRDWLNR
jgi:sugar phosphate isomerase/epimerase